MYYTANDSPWEVWTTINFFPVYGGASAGFGVDSVFVAPAGVDKRRPYEFEKFKDAKTQRCALEIRVKIGVEKGG